MNLTPPFDPVSDLTESKLISLFLKHPDRVLDFVLRFSLLCSDGVSWVCKPQTISQLHSTYCVISTPPLLLLVPVLPPGWLQRPALTENQLRDFSSMKG